jgi:hypothetical protein
VEDPPLRAPTGLSPAQDGSTLIVPVGQDIGAHVRDTRAIRRVRRGAGVHELSQTQYLVWGLAHGCAQAVSSQAAWDAESVTELARAAGVRGPVRVLEELMRDQLLVEVSPGSDAATEFARTHRVIPLMLGLGNSAADPALFDIGFVGAPMMQVDFPTYDLWQWSAMSDSLYDTCESAADVARRANSAQRSYLDADKLLTDFLGELHSLLLARAACVDICFRLDRPPSPTGAHAKAPA